jgi:hypothetical protein
MKRIHVQAKHPRGSSPNQETDRGVGDRLGRLRSVVQTPENLLTAQESSPDWQRDEEGRWI